MTTRSVVEEVVRERSKQDRKWGEQNHPDGTGPYYADELHYYPGSRWAILADAARDACKAAAADGSVTWLQIAREEVYEAFAESDPVKLRAELIQVAATATAWAEAIDRRPA